MSCEYVSGINKNHELDSSYIMSDGAIENVEHHSFMNNRNEIEKGK